MVSGSETYRHSYNRGDIGLGVIISFLLLLFFYPEFIFLTKTPMHSSGWELMDPIVSYTNFKPCFNVFQYELYHHGNILWSSLRSLGMPILANDIQAAPLFPLTLVLSWLDDDIFWNVFIVSRIFLMCLGTFLLLRKFFRFERLPSLYFVVIFVFSLYVMRWMNHPWQNGFVAGIWYLYFLCQVSVQGRGYTLRRFGCFIGLIIAVYSMVTCGFPEAAVMSAMWVLFVYPPLLFNLAYKKKVSWKQLLPDMFLAHLLGFALSSFQIFSIIELLSLSISYRTNVGFNQYLPADIVPFFLEILARFRPAGPELYENNRTFLGLIPFTFFIVGVGVTLRRIRTIGYGEIGAIFCGIFILLKFFAIGPPWFNTMIASAPILKDTYFFVYFFTLFLWFFAFFSARGFQAIMHFLCIPQEKDKIIFWGLSLLVVQSAALIFVLWAGQSIYNLKFYELLKPSESNIFLKSVILFSGTFLILPAYWLVKRQALLVKGLPFVLICLVVLEVFLTLPKNFNELQITSENRQLQVLLQRLKERNIPLSESRIIDRFGSYVSQGLATIDNGSTPLLPERMELFKQTFFDGKLPRSVIRAPKNSISWAISSTNIRAVDRFHGGGATILPSWSDMERRVDGLIYLDSLSFNQQDLNTNNVVEIEGKGGDFFTLRGWAVGDIRQGLEGTEVYIVFKRKNTEIVIPTRRANRPDVVNHLGNRAFMKAGWEGFFSAIILPSGTYEIIIRLADHKTNEYYEYKTKASVSFSAKNEVFEKEYLMSITGKENEYLGMLGQYYIYLDRTTLPRAYTASKCTPFVSKQKLIQAIRKRDEFEIGHAFVEELTDEEVQLCREIDSSIKRVPILYDKGKELSLAAIQGPAVLMLNDNYYPGWKAYDVIERKSLNIKPGNITFRTIVLPENRQYQVVFTYKPFWLTYGWVLVICSLMTILGVGLFYLKTKQRRV